MIKIYNEESGKKESFKPIKKGFVGIYNCGPTVYDTAHIGNFRTFVMDDLIRRIFEYQGLEVSQVMNSTDVDDKTIKRSQEEEKTLSDLTKHYENLFISDLKSLNILLPHKFLRATEHIKEMIEMIQILLEKGFAYPTKDGVYFSIGMFSQYGKLANIKLNKEVKERIANDEYEKENPRDFALWKFSTKEDGNIGWEAPFGRGRPGWHIECSAMATSVLGPTIDVHTGGADLLFPHHTNEIAQSEAATDKKFVNYWIHVAFMNVNEDKMSKSKGNFLKLSDLEDHGISPLGFRYWLLTSHYRSPVNFTVEAVKGAQNAFIRIVETFIDLTMPQIHDDHHHSHVHLENVDYKSQFEKAISDDFNTPEALALVWKLIKDPAVENREKVKLLLDFDRVFGFGLKLILEMTQNENEIIPEDVMALSEARDEARKNREWEKADALRKEIEQRGYELKDLGEETRLRKIN